MHPAIGRRRQALRRAVAVAAAVVACIVVAGPTGAADRPGPGASIAPPATRGRLLYETHCIECHRTQMHWRDRRIATDWRSLKAQVRHWQALAFLNWSEPDIVEVTRHLNDSIYHFAQTEERVGRLQRPR